MTQPEQFQVDRFLRKQAAARMALNAAKTIKTPAIGPRTLSTPWKGDFSKGTVGGFPKGSGLPSVVPPIRSNPFKATPGWSGPTASGFDGKGLATGMAIGGTGAGGAAFAANQMK